MIAVIRISTVLESSAEEIAQISTLPSPSLLLYTLCVNLMSATVQYKRDEAYDLPIKDVAGNLPSVSRIKTLAGISAVTRGVVEFMETINPFVSSENSSFIPRSIDWQT